MKSVSNKPNWLFRGFIGVSLAVHLAIFMHVSGMYRSNDLSYIELTMHDVSKPVARSIPRPRHRPKKPDRPKEIKKLKIVQRTIPKFKPIQVDPVEKNLPDSLVEGIAMPDVSATPGLEVADWSPDALIEETGGDFLTAQNYLEMVRLRIERHKKYPQTARAKGIEGRVTIRFIITPEGGVRGVEVAKHSRNKTLDLAAVRAVQDATPFSRPPRRFFKGDIPLEVTIVFELT